MDHLFVQARNMPVCLDVSRQVITPYNSTCALKNITLREDFNQKQRKLVCVQTYFNLALQRANCSDGEPTNKWKKRWRGKHSSR